MVTLCVPPMDEEPWPTLGPQVVAWMEDNLVFGPGDLIGEPYRLNNEQKALVYRMYEIQPRCSCWGTRQCLDAHRRRPGPRRFKRCALSLRKGLMKTELMAAITAAELCADAPVRCVSWYKLRGGEWMPEGAGVTSPFIPMLATSEEQVERLAFGALYEMTSRSRLARELDIGLERIMRRGGDGYAEPVSTAPNQNDGARTSFQGFDETHRLYLPNQRGAVDTMLNNIPKRPLADPWTLETTTSFALGQNSVAETTMGLAREIAEGRAKNPAFFFFHREAGEGHDISTEAGLRAAIVEATGPDAMTWTDVGGIEAIYNDPTSDKVYFERVWLNRAKAVAGHAFDVQKWLANGQPDQRPMRGELITLGFDGSLSDDATALVGTDVRTGLQWPVGIWERPAAVQDWEVPKDEVDAAVAEAFATWNVWRMYGDPSKWDLWMASWAGRYDLAGKPRVIGWPTTLHKKVATTLKAYANAIAAGEVLNNGDRQMAAHIGNAWKKPQSYVDDDGAPLWLIRKENPTSAKKIDAAMAGALSWQARLDAIASGALNEDEIDYSVYSIT